MALEHAPLPILVGEVPHANHLLLGVGDLNAVIGQGAVRVGELDGQFHLSLSRVFLHGKQGCGGALLLHCYLDLVLPIQGEGFSIFQNHLFHRELLGSCLGLSFQKDLVSRSRRLHRVAVAVDDHPFRLKLSGVAAFKPQGNGLAFVKNGSLAAILGLGLQSLKGKLVV